MTTNDHARAAMHGVANQITTQSWATAVNATMWHCGNVQAAQIVDTVGDRYDNEARIELDVRIRGARR